MLSEQPVETRALSFAEAKPFSSHEPLRAVSEDTVQQLHRGTASWPLQSAHLYDGIAGVALFLAAYYSISEDEKAHDLAIRLITPLSAKIDELAMNPDRACSVRIPVGGFIGLGSFLYTFTWTAEWLRDESLVQAARSVAALITPDRIGADEKLDVMSGCAGTILALLRFADSCYVARSESERALGLATHCGKRLLHMFSSWGAARQGNTADTRVAISGFAHGAAGISYALLRLFENTGDKKYLDTALEGFAFERSLYRPSDNNWLDPRFDRPVQQSAWCHGAPGIALARLSGQVAIGVPAVEGDLQQALTISRQLPDYLRDHLCCGNSGLIQILHAAGQRLRGRTDLTQEAWCRLERMLRRSHVSGFCFDCETTAPEFNPSLFTGLSGVGFTALRLQYPNRIPCVLLMD